MAEPFTEQEQVLLRRIAGAMIGPSDALNVPGADDDEIFARFLQGAATAESRLRQSMGDFFTKFGGVTAAASLDEQEFRKIIDAARQKYHPFTDLMTRLVTRAYYGDPRLLFSLDREDRPPFPKGNELEQGDWSLLDPVRDRKPIFRRC